MNWIIACIEYVKGGCTGGYSLGVLDGVWCLCLGEPTLLLIKPMQNKRFCVYMFKDRGNVA